MSLFDKVNGQHMSIDQLRNDPVGAAKRAGFNIGIGRELYTAPFIWIGSDKVKIENKGGKLSCYDRLRVKTITYDDDKIDSLVIVNAKDQVVFEQKPKKKSKPKSKSESKSDPIDFSIDETLASEISPAEASAHVIVTPSPHQGKMIGVVYKEGGEEFLTAMRDNPDKIHPEDVPFVIAFMNSIDTFRTAV